MGRIKRFEYDILQVLRLIPVKEGGELVIGVTLAKIMSGLRDVGKITSKQSMYRLLITLQNEGLIKSQSKYRSAGFPGEGRCKYSLLTKRGSEYRNALENKDLKPPVKVSPKKRNVTRTLTTKRAINTSGGLLELLATSRIPTK